MACDGRLRRMRTLTVGSRDIITRITLSEEVAYAGH